MTKLPRWTGKQLMEVLKRADFQVVRVRGSHHFLRHDDGRATVIPVHPDETIGPGLLAKILRDRELTRDDIQLLRRDG